MTLALVLSLPPPFLFGTSHHIALKTKFGPPPAVSHCDKMLYISLYANAVSSSQSERASELVQGTLLCILQTAHEVIRGDVMAFHTELEVAFSTAQKV